MVPQQQVPGILAAQADAACVLEVRGAALAQGVAVWRGRRGHTEGTGSVSAGSHHYTQGQRGSVITLAGRRRRESSPKAGHPRKGDVWDLYKWYV